MCIPRQLRYLEPGTPSASRINGFTRGNEQVSLSRGPGKVHDFYILYEIVENVLKYSSVAPDEAPRMRAKIQVGPEVP